MRAVAVKFLVTEAVAYMVCSVAGMRFSRSAQPNPSSQRISPFRATATATDGTTSSTRPARIIARTALKSTALAAAVFLLTVGCLIFTDADTGTQAQPNDSATALMTDFALILRSLPRIFREV